MSYPIVAISGGLGNQIFQLARALDIDEQVILDFDSGGSYTEKKADILEFNLPNQIQLGYFKKTKLLRIFYNGILGKSTSAHFFAPLLSKIYRYFFQFLYLTANRRYINVISSKGVGFHATKIRQNPCLVGYFQSFRWAESARVFKLLMELSPKRKSDELENAILKISASDSIALHVRLGDYLHESDFGILSETYYVNALTKIDTEWFNRDIWIFSDDINLAKLRLSNLADQAKSINWIGAINHSTVETWYLMRHATDFVIANSTFSWWAAFLRQNQKGIVCAPQPWFKGMESPVDLIPSMWLRENAFTENPL